MVQRLLEVCLEDSLIHMLSAFPSAILKNECHRTECGSAPFWAALEDVIGKLHCLMGRGNKIILENSKIL